MSDKFIGFYLHYMPMREQLEDLIFQFCKQLLARLGMFNSNRQDVLLEDASSQRVRLKESHMVMKSVKASGTSQHCTDGLIDLFLFQGDYMDVLQDGTVLFNALKMLVDTLGGKTADEMNDQLQHYTDAGKSSPHLRVFYWQLARSFVTKLPLEFQIAFSVDCLLYGQWRVSHPNLIGLHLLMLAWMLGIKELQTLMPEVMRSFPIMVTPPFASCIHSLRLKRNLSAKGQQHHQLTATNQTLPEGRKMTTKIETDYEKMLQAPAKAK